MGSVDPIFEFKKHFEREEADRFVASIIQHKPVWMRIQEEEFLYELILAFKNNKEIWTAAHICLYASGYTPHLNDLEVIKTKVLQGQLKKANVNISNNPDNSLGQLTATAINHLLTRHSGKGWLEILESLLAETPDSANKIRSNLGTIISIIYLLSDDRRGLISTLACSGNEIYQELLAFLIGCNPGFIDKISQELLAMIQNIEIREFTHILEALYEYVENSVIKTLADNYLAHKPVPDRKINGSKNISISDELIEKIKIYRDYALLAKYGSDPKQSEKYSRTSTDLSDQLNQFLEKLSTNLTFDQGAIEKTTDYYVNEINAVSDQLGSGHIAIKLLRMIEIQNTDVESAKKIGRDVCDAILQSSSIRQIIPSTESGSILKPSQIIRLFQELDMIIEAAQIFEKLIELQPRNLGLIKQGAKLFFDHGDSEKAVEYFARYSLSKELSREEKLFLFEAFTNLGLWQNAFKIWNEINLVSLEDYQQKAICAYKVNDQAVFEETSAACKNFYNADGIFNVLCVLFTLRSGQLSAAQAEIEAVLSTKKRDRFTIQYVIEYYLAVSQPEKALEWINSLSSLEKEYPEVSLLLYRIHRLLGDDESCNRVINSLLKKGKSFTLSIAENFAEELIQNDNYIFAERTIEKFIEKWPLSPNLIGCKAHMLVENGNYLTAQNLLVELIQRKTIKESWVINYALTKVERKFKTSPLGDSSLEQDSSQNLDDFEKEIFEKYPNNLILRSIKAELSKKDRLSAYQDILADKRVHNHPEIWRVHAGMGKHYFQNQKFDMALVSFKEARKQQPRLKAINLYMINALAKMKLTDEALDILSVSIRENQFSLHELLEINTNMKHSEQWLRMLKGMAVGKENSTTTKIILAQLYTEMNKSDKAWEIINKIIFTDKSELFERLVSAQILINAGFLSEAKHMLEYMLTSRKEINKKELLAGAFLYMQMQEQHKAANLLNLVGNNGYLEEALKTYLYENIGLIKEYGISIQNAINKLDEGDYGEENGSIAWINKPEIWDTLRNDKVWVYLKSIETSLYNKDYKGALEKAEKYIEKFPSDLRLSSMALNIIDSFGGKKNQDMLLEKLPENLKEFNIDDSVCVYGELALEKGHEIMAANLVSQCLERFPDSSRVRALQARLLNRNGNDIEAKQLINKIIDEANSKNTASSGKFTGNALWLAEAAMDLGREKEALRQCEKFFSEYEFSPKSVRLFLASILEHVIENWINKKLNVIKHNDQIEPKDLKFFNDICVITNEDITADQEIQNLIKNVKIWLDILNGKTEKLSGLDYSGLDEKTILAVKMQTNAQGNLELSFEGSDEDQKVFFSALMLMETRPENALKYMSDLIRKTEKDPRYFTALAMIKKSLGRFDDAYAAINLALASAEWTDEYKWQILAGELSQAMGDMHTSLMHFQKAAELHKSKETQALLGKVNYQAGNRFGISFLENSLTGRKDDLETLIDLSQLSIKNEKYQKAAKYIEKAMKINPNDIRSYVLLSKVAIKVGNLIKAEEIIGRANQIDASDIELTLRKIEIEEYKNGAPDALKWINAYLEDNNKTDFRIVNKKAELLAGVEGNHAALNFLRKQNQKDENAVIQLKIAQLYMEEANYEQAEIAAEKVLHLDSNNAAALNLLANVYKQNGDLDKALDFLIKAIQLNPFAVNFYIELAKIYQTRRELEQAAETLQNGLRSNPMNLDLLQALGLLFYQQGFYKRSEEYLKQAAAIDPNNDNVKRLLSTLMNANIIQPEKFSANT